MSGMFDKKADKASRKLARTKQEEKAKKKSRTRAIIIVAVLLLVTAIAITINSNFIRRSLTVLTIDGVGFTTAEFEYFYNTEYMEYIQFISQFQGMEDMLPDPGRSLSSQVYDLNPETGEITTWADMITAGATARMANIVSLYNAAEKAGFKLSDEHLAEIDEDMAILDLQAITRGFPSADSYLQQMYGKSMNEAVYRSILEFVYTASLFNEYMRESLSFDNGLLDGYYQENRDSLDVFSYRMFSVNFDPIDFADFESEDEYNEAIESAITETHERAAQIILEGFDSEEDFITAAQEEFGSTMDWVGGIQSRMGEELDSFIKDWLLDGSREYGDAVSIDNDTGSTIVYFVSRDDNSYLTVGMRQILIPFITVNIEEFEGEDDPGYIQALQQAEIETRERAEHVYSLFIAAGRTEDALIDLMPEYSEDTTIGGSYSNIAKYPYQSSHFAALRVVSEIEDWLFDESRVIGDAELVFTNAYGYHLLYFTGFGEPLSRLIADDRMRTSTHNEWLDSLVPGEPVKHFAFILVQM